MLALKDERHVVEASVPGLADLARVTVEECREALKKLEGPDSDSRNQEHDGRRIERCDGGWLILNGEYYREKMSQDDRREYQRDYQRKRRKRLKKGTPLAGEEAYDRAFKRGDDPDAEQEDREAALKQWRAKEEL